MPNHSRASFHLRLSLAPGGDTSASRVWTNSRVPFPLSLALPPWNRPPAGEGSGSHLRFSTVRYLEMGSVRGLSGIEAQAQDRTWAWAVTRRGPTSPACCMYLVSSIVVSCVLLELPHTEVGTFFLTGRRIQTD